MKIIVFSACLFIGIAICLLQTELSIFSPITDSVFASSQNPLEADKFGIREIYPTKENGREWYMNMENPKEDEHFSITFNPNITKQEDGSWRISTPVVRMNVKTLEGETNWKNVEMTGYAKIAGVIENSSNKVIENDLTWYARGGKHNQEIPCEATAYMGGLYDNGKVGWKKELWFVGGYTDERQSEKVTNSLVDRWVGWKVVIYNINDNSEVKLESYIDNTNTNYWVKVTDLVDDGGWFAKMPDSHFFDADCSKDKDFIITNSGSTATFRSDNLIWDFKNLSVREIQPAESFYQ
ncbi:MAG TPA: hypothetical protein VJ772_04635 [Nitrososphaeraceae archaeon]|jgi:hypothetical protein|nr:hypothetical protein [Nitrososphaeraceae archaeon]